MRARYLLAQIDLFAILHHDVLTAVVHHAASAASRVALLPAVGAVGGRSVLSLPLSLALALLLRARPELALACAFACAVPIG